MAIKGIKGQPFINLTNVIDLTEFDEIQPEFFKGFALAKNLAQIGNLDIDHNWLDISGNYKPLIIAYEEFKSLPNNHELKIATKDLTKDELATFLKFAFGGYDLYTTYHKHLFEDYFPSFNKWIKKINVFETITDAFIMTMEAGGISFEHRHPPVNPNDTSILSEFIHIRPNLLKPFYVRNPKTLEKNYINSRIAYWNDQDPHGGEPIMQPAYSIRIDGKFTDDFRNKILHGV